MNLYFLTKNFLVYNFKAVCECDIKTTDTLFLCCVSPATLLYAVNVSES